MHRPGGAVAAVSAAVALSSRDGGRHITPPVVIPRGAPRWGWSIPAAPVVMMLSARHAWRADREQEPLMADLVYEVSFKGVASPMLHAAFPGCDLDTGAGLTVVRCNQDALRGVIERIEELALQLLHIRL